MSYYRVCPDCGCSLDPGERCDCAREREEREAFFQSRIMITKTGQMKFVFGEKEAGNEIKSVF